MKIDRRDGSVERQILIGMVVDPQVLSRVASKWNKEGLFRSKWCNLVGSWCVRYFNKYEKPPRKNLEGMFENWAGKSKDKETVQLVEKFLENISGEYAALKQSLNAQFVIDSAAEHFRQVQLRRLADGLTDDLDDGNATLALSKVTSFDNLEMGVGAGIDVLQDKMAIQQAFEQKKEPLIVYPKGAGKFFGDSLERDGFISFFAPEKRGKTFWLLDMAWRGLLQRRRVAFFQTGDLSQGQMMLRFMARAANRPLRAEEIQVPLSMSRIENERAVSVEHKRVNFKNELSWQEAYKMCNETLLAKVRSKESLLRLSCHPNSTLSVPGIHSILKDWDRQGWSPDIIVIDYADIMLHNILGGGADSRDQINSTWKALRGLSQSRHCLVVTASQTDAASYNAWVITRSHFSEDKRKLAHLTGCIGINQSAEEKEIGVSRLNWVVRREGHYSENVCCYFAGCLAVANPAIRSLF